MVGPGAILRVWVVKDWHFFSKFCPHLYLGFIIMIKFFSVPSVENSNELGTAEKFGGKEHKFVLTKILLLSGS